jgi:trimeric autotransporter adhesin
MARSHIGQRLNQLIARHGMPIASGRATRRWPGKTGRFLGIESLESRALLANIIASGTISSAPDGGNTDYTIALANSRNSTAAIGTFLYAGVPGEHFLATNPISVAPPTGWTEQVNHSGSSDGYAIQFVASSAAYDVQPGSSLIFSFLSADPPSSVEGTSDFYFGVPVGTSFVYQNGPQSGASDEFIVTSAASLQSIAVTPGNVSLPTGATTQFTATGTYSDNSTQILTDQVTWGSSVSSVATVSNTPGSHGLATVNGPGSTTISASLDGISGSTMLTTTSAALQSITITPASPFVGLGHTEQFTATGTYSDNTTQNLTGTVTWSSGTTAVATISNAVGSNGLATAVGIGTSTIAASSNGITATTVIAVTPALQSIQVTPADPSVPKGDTEQFRATAVFENNST